MCVRGPHHTHLKEQSIDGAVTTRLAYNNGARVTCAPIRLTINENQSKSCSILRSEFLIILKSLRSPPERVPLRTVIESLYHVRCKPNPCAHDSDVKVPRLRYLEVLERYETGRKDPSCAPSPFARAQHPADHADYFHRLTCIPRHLRHPVAHVSVTAAKQAISGTDSAKISGAKTTTSPKTKSPSPIYLRDKGKWNAVSAEYNRLHINYTSAHNTLHDIKISVDFILDFRSLISLLIKCNFPFHTYALEEGRKIKAVLRNIPLENPTDCIKSDLENQNYSVFAVQRMHRRDSTELGLVLVVLHKSDTAKDIFKYPPKVCGLSGITVEAPYLKAAQGNVSVAKYTTS
ncbi:hypothetical protein EVAR_15744_1 [Eumeta japonica]|uniref:Pre-C2HC domain-containing protein n=1 Tax=Eumeta variegata TaxID=151549 RepID=A0A4C1ZBL8_EUMVA|nr:hypothetical protein EVAR_15744_1 [Eumeta japonica]